MNNNLLKSLIITLLSAMSLNAMAAPDNTHHDWEDNHVLQQHRLPARAYFMPFGTTRGDRQITLNGEWKFRWTPTPEVRIKDFYRTDFNDSQWDTFRVPANWEVNDYGTPIYASAGYTFRIDPPYVTKEPKQNYTAFVERNPTGQYRRTFNVPQQWIGNHIIVRFDGAMSAFYVWVNGERAGYSQGSCEASEFDITPYVKAGENQIALEVYKYSDGAYLEDQDFWRFGGIHRSITLYNVPSVRLRDFTVRTIAADDTYQNFRLQINPKLQALDNATGEGYRVKAILHDAQGNEVMSMTTDAEPILDLQHKAATMNEWYPQRGHMKFERMDTLLYNIRAWTAETPYLYSLTLQVVDGSGNVREQATEKVGFREVRINHGRFLINGKQVRMRGVNRHEHDPKLAHVMTDEMMLKDLKLMKEANVNAIRLAHYPNDPRFYELCDSMGFYLIDEANAENHGVRGTFTSTPDWNDAMMDRVIRMAERDKNHPSVVLWSLGNESGYGANHASMAGWLHEFDPTRYVHYEGAQGYNGEPDPQCVDVISRFYPRVQEEYLNPGIPEGSDQERAENARWEFLRGIAQRSWVFKDGIAVGKIDDRPVMTSEYAHCMGNALGNFKEYWDEFYSNPRMMGGFIWDWVDQGIYKDWNGKKMVAFGGDFGDKPNLKAFCMNGVIFCDRTTNSKFQEVKQIYSPVQFSIHGNDIYVINRSSHLPLSAYSARWELLNNGVAAKQKKGKDILSLPEIAYGDSAVVAHVADYDCVAGADNRLNIHVTQNEDGHHVSTSQIALKGNIEDFAGSAIHKKLTAYQPMQGKAQYGLPGVEVKATFYRAPLDNDTGFGNWLAKDWQKQHIDSPIVVRIDAETEIYKFAEGSVKVTTKVTPMDGGMYDVVQTYTCEGNVPELPRMGMQIVLPAKMEQVKYYGRGPWDNYPDRKQSAHVGLWSSTVTDEYVHYPRPQDSGNHEDCAFVMLSDGKKQSYSVTAVDKPFSFSALHYLPTTIASTKHDCELVEDGITVLTVMSDVLGIGNGSCGPGVLKRYSIDKTVTHTLHVVIK